MYEISTQRNFNRFQLLKRNYQYYVPQQFRKNRFSESQPNQPLMHLRTTAASTLFKISIGLPPPPKIECISVTMDGVATFRRRLPLPYPAMISRTSHLIARLLHFRFFTVQFSLFFSVSSVTLDFIRQHKKHPPNIHYIERCVCIVHDYFGEHLKCYSTTLAKKRSLRVFNHQESLMANSLHKDDEFGRWLLREYISSWLQKTFLYFRFYSITCNGNIQAFIRVIVIKVILKQMLSRRQTTTRCYTAGSVQSFLVVMDVLFFEVVTSQMTTQSLA